MEIPRSRPVLKLTVSPKLHGAVHVAIRMRGARAWFAGVGHLHLSRGEWHAVRNALMAGALAAEIDVIVEGSEERQP